MNNKTLRARSYRKEL